MTPTSRVCVVGSLNMDLVVRAPRIPTAGETILGGAYRTFPGGKGANQAVAAARMGAAVSLVGALGDDAHAQKLRTALEPEGIDLTHLMTREGEATGLALITVTEGGENTIVVAPGANALVTPEDIQAAKGAIEAADVLLIQLESPNPVVFEAIGLAHAAGKAVILNAAPARVLPRDVLRKVDVLVVNRPEAALLLGVSAGLDPARLALGLPTLGPATVLLTLGQQGAILSHKGRPRRVPTVQVTPVDSVGAGDAFCGALASQWAPVHAAAKARSQEEYPLAERAVLIASAAGALATGKSGAIPSLPRLEEVLPLADGLKIGT